MAYVTGYTYAVLTNQSTAIVYVTVCTSRGVRTLFDQSARDILISVLKLAIVDVIVNCLETEMSKNGGVL